MIMEVLSTPNMPEPSKEELLRQQKLFLAGAGQTISRAAVSPQLCEAALYLLCHLPVSREAVLEWYGHVLDGLLARYSVEAASGGYSYEEEEIMAGMSRTLSRLVSSSPSPWAPIISSWSLDCLGKLSSK